MKSSLIQASNKAMIVSDARFHLPAGRQVWPLKKNYKQMKSSMTQAKHIGLIAIDASFSQNKCWTGYLIPKNKITYR